MIDQGICKTYGPFMQALSTWVDLFIYTAAVSNAPPPQGIASTVYTIYSLSFCLSSPLRVDDYVTDNQEGQAAK